jgi:pSer/pThr/pTyr-binding forkhead associated (FHA) protein
MSHVTLQVLEGIDQGRVFRNLPTPLTIGREEGNLLRLNDERVSRFHAKIQVDNGDVILTDLESTNGTRVNGNIVQIRRLRVGDCISVGRSLLLFGSHEEIAARMATMANATHHPEEEATSASVHSEGPATVRAEAMPAHTEPNVEFDLNLKDDITTVNGEIYVGAKPLPPLPQKLSPAQAARLAEILDFLHRGLSFATEHMRSNDDGTVVQLNYADWQKVMAVQLLLARYLRSISEPESLSCHGEVQP